MVISVAQLETLLNKLQSLQQRLKNTDRSPSSELTESDPLVQAANECDFILPSPLTINTLQETVDRKIDNVLVLLERARQHEELPPDVQMAAEHEDILIRNQAPPSRDAA